MRLYTIPKSRIAMYPLFRPLDPLALLSPWETCSATLSDLLERIFPPTCLISSYPVLNQFIAENNFTEHACIELYHNKEPIKYGFLPLSSRGLGTSSILTTALCSARPWKIWTTLMLPSSNFLLLSIPHYSIFIKDLFRCFVNHWYTTFNDFHVSKSQPVPCILDEKMAPKWMIKNEIFLDDDEPYWSSSPASDWLAQFFIETFIQSNRPRISWSAYLFCSYKSLYVM